MTDTIPLALKIGHTLFLAVLVPVYWRHYGPANFLWFSDIALIVTGVALWLESGFLVSMMAVGLLLPELLWNAEYFARLLTGRSYIGLTDYMFRDSLPLGLRALSLFHVYLPVLLLWLLHRLGYQKDALVAQVAFGAIVMVASYLLTDPKDNVNWVFGPGGQPRIGMPRLAYLAAVIVAFPIVVYLPTHFALVRWFGQPR